MVCKKVFCINISAGRRLCLLVSALCVCLFVSCANPFSADIPVRSHTVRFEGTIPSGACPEQIARSLMQMQTFRSALPGFNFTAGAEGAVEYFAVASPDDNSGDLDGVFDDADRPNVFGIELDVDKVWTITCGIRLQEDHDVIIMQDQIENVTVSLGDSIFTHTFTIVPVEEGTGSIELDIDKDASAAAVSSISAKLISSDGTERNLFSNITYKTSVPTLPQWARIHVENLASGSYELIINFLSASSFPLFTTVQTVNVFNGCSTDTWVSDGTALISSDGMKITSALISQASRNTYYVGVTGAVGADGNAVTPSSENSGSPYAPLNAVANAINRIKSFGNGGDYTIYISGTVAEADIQIPSALNLQKASSITICGLHGKEEDAIDAERDGRCLNISTEVPVIIRDLKITNGYVLNEDGAGIYMGSETDVTLASGAWITGNKAEGNNSDAWGGGIFCSGGTLTLKSGSVVGSPDANRYAQYETGKWANYAGSGGGIAFDSGTVTVERGAKVSYNFATWGGGICCHSREGITLDRVLNISGGEISYNATSPRANKGQPGENRDYGWYSYGGGLFVFESTLNFTSGTIHDNYSSDGGGAIIVQETSSAFMSGGSIYNNASYMGPNFSMDTAETCKKCAEILLFDNCTFTMTGGTLSCDTQEERAVYYNESATPINFKLGGDAVISENCTVCLNDSKPLTIISNLTSTEYEEHPVVIDVDGETHGDVLVVSDPEADISAYKDYFVLSDSLIDQDDELKLSGDKKKLFLNIPIWVAATEGSYAPCSRAGNDGNGKGTKVEPFASLARARDWVIDNGDLEWTIKVAGVLTAPQEITDAGDNAAAIYIVGANAPDTNGNPVDGICTEAGTALSIPDDSNDGLKVYINNLKITGKNAERGGGLCIGYGASGEDENLITLTLGDGALVTGCTATMSGGGVYIKKSTLYVTGNARITDCQVTTIDEENQLSYCGGGIYDSDSTVYIQDDAIVSGNKSTGRAGGILTTGSLFISGNACIGERSGTAATSKDYSSNSALIGGGIYAFNSGATVWIGYTAQNVSDPDATCTISYNYATGNDEDTYGGGGIAVSASAKCYMASGSIEHNGSASYGGGLYMAETQGKFYFSGGTIKSNAAALYGGGICSRNGTCYMYGTATVGGSEPADKNTAANGGGVALILNGNLFMGRKDNDVQIAFTGGVIGNQASEYGGGVYVSQGNLNIYRGTLSSNSAPIGAGIRLVSDSGAKALLKGGTISGNNNTDTDFAGGAVCSAGSLTLLGSISIPYGNGKGKNDVSYISERLPQIGEFTNVTSGQKVVTLAPPVYQRKLEAVEPQTGLEYAQFEEAVSHIAVASDGDGNGWEIYYYSNTGKAKLQPAGWTPQTAYYVSSTGTTGGSGTQTSPVDSISTAIGLIVDQDYKTNYTIYIDGTISSAQTVSSTLTTDYAAMLTIAGTNSGCIDLNGANGTALSVTGTSVPVTIRTLTLKRAGNSSNCADNGGGLYVEDANVTLGNGTSSGEVNITGNYAQYGGGVYSTGTLTITSYVTISGNTALGSAGGLFAGGTVNMKAGEIRNNTGTYGVYVPSTGIFTMSGGSIGNNSSSEVYVYNGRFKLKDSAYIYGGALELPNLDTITIAGKLDLPSAANGLAAKIKFQSYVENTQVLVLESNPDPSTSIGDEYYKFRLWDDAYKINSTGYIEEAIVEQSCGTLDAIVTAINSMSPGDKLVITLTANITASTTSESTPALSIPSNANVVLKAASEKKITFPNSSDLGFGDYNFIKVERGAKLTLESGITLQGASYGNACVHPVYVDNGAELVMETGSKITGFYNNGNGGVYVSRGTFTMNGGTLSYGKARYGFAVYLVNGTFNFNDGTITDFYCISSSYGYWIDGSGTMNSRVSVSSGIVSPDLTYNQN